jgi:hypothetical protein
MIMEHLETKKMELFIARNKFTIPVENVEIVHEPL